MKQKQKRKDTKDYELKPITTIKREEHNGGESKETKTGTRSRLSLFY
jgi:hypothetical protein